MKFTVYYVNERGLDEIRQFLADNHKDGADRLERVCLLAWARDAEDQMDQGNRPTIWLRAHESVYGYAQEYTISEAGVDGVTVEVD